MRILVNLLIGTLAVLITGYLLPGVSVTDFWTGVVIAALLALLNVLVKPILVVLTIPITVLTLGLFLFVINALMVMIVAEIVPGFTVGNFWWALLFSLILSIINSLLSSVLSKA
ncbi:phage holin family protein [Pararhodonellum marinum]|uniref:phage holin family protein n=1 Tax=Pararhodonellum marinum TaxID=2755358 RepID=UPI00188DF4D6|nr:phage holin family protein [Pararhodonellum marinum]